MFLLLTLNLVGSSEFLGAKDDLRENSVREVFDLYRIKMSSYCEDYNWTDRLDIQEYLLTAQEIDFSSDIPGLDLYQLTASDYFHFLSQERVKITYAKDYNLEVCSDSPPVYGITVAKEIRTKEGDLRQYEEYIEVHLDEQNEARIHALASSRYSAYEDIDCLKEATAPPPARAVEDDPDCPPLLAAEQAKKDGRISDAIAYLEQSLDCPGKAVYVSEQLTLLRNRKAITALLAKGASAYGRGDLKTSFSIYQTLLGAKLRPQLTETEEQLVRNNLADIRVALTFAELVAAGDHHLSAHAYQKAKLAYEKAAALRPGDARIKDKIAAANQYLAGAFRSNALR
ncbi:MAG: hypothetical protein AAF597_00545 [Bacteroidota bacterium]